MIKNERKITPGQVYENISEIQNQAQLMTNTPITKSDLVYQVINAAPRMYKMIVR